MMEKRSSDTCPSTLQRACLAALENLHAKYAVTAEDIEGKREEATAKLQGFLEELGYV